MANEPSGQQGTLLARHIVENFPNGAIFVVDRDLRFLFAAGREIEEAGLTSSALEGRTIIEALPPEIVDDFVPPCEEALDGQTIEFEHRYGGHVYSMIASPLDRSGDLVTSVLLVSRNITRHKMAEEDNARLLRNSQETTEREQGLRLRAEAAEERFRRLFDATADAIAVFDAKGNYTNANQALCSLLGYTREELLSGNVFQLLMDPEYGREQFEVFLRKGRWRGELDVVHKDGHIIAVEAHGAVLPMPDGTLHIAVLRDITQRRELESMQKEFLSAVAHELRNPLTPIIGFARILKRQRTYSDAVVDDILHHAEILERRLDDLLETTRVDDGQIQLYPTDTDLVALARESVRQMQALHPGFTIRLVANAEPVAGWWDRHRLEQVLTNLLSNAVKYSPESTEIVVTVEAGPEEATVSVVDRGMGIPHDQLQRLFNRFFRTSNARAHSVKGFGLGLYVARGLVEAHGGRIWARSEGTGKGSSFVFSLPLRYLPAE